MLLEQISAISICIAPGKLRPRFEYWARLIKTNFHFRYCPHSFLVYTFPVGKYIVQEAFRFNTLLQSDNIFVYLLQEMTHNTHHNALHEASEYECILVGSNLREIAMKKWRYCVTYLSHPCEDFSLTFTANQELIRRPNFRADTSIAHIVLYKTGRRPCYIFRILLYRIFQKFHIPFLIGSKC